ncbi:MAG: elongation factor G [Clostridia bacterium]|nr:elongation factor G [Clostridia bacterium]
MAKIPAQDIRNICLLGHSGVGKTSIAEAMLYIANCTDRLGKVEDGNTVCDHDAESVKRGFSVCSSIANLMWKDTKINLIDTPGYFDFSGGILEALRVAATALIVVDGIAGVEVGTEIALDRANEADVPHAFIVNKVDDPAVKFEKVFKQLRDTFGHAACPIFLPVNEVKGKEGIIDLINLCKYTYKADGTDMRQQTEIPEEYKAKVELYRGMLMESLAETSDELMEKFFEGEEFTVEEIKGALQAGLLSGAISPVIPVSATNLWGIRLLLDTVVDTFPSPISRRAEKIMTDEGMKYFRITETGNTSIFVFKTVADPFVGKMSYFKVMTGELKKDTVLNNLTTGGTEKISRIYTLCGKKQTEVDSLSAGDIGMTAKLNDTNTNDTLSTNDKMYKYTAIKFPTSFMQMAIKPKAKGDEDKIASGIARLLEEDPSIKYVNNAETKEQIIYGQGDMHLEVTVSRLKSRFGVAVELTKPKIAYREAIKGTADTEAKYKKQSGGHGQYGHIKVKFAPGEKDGLEFTQSVVGGTVPKNFYPAVEKGLLESMQAGVLAGFPVMSLKCDLYDGSYHPVDSSEMAFKVAANMAYKVGMAKAKPIILEPYGKLYVYAPSDMLGDIMGAITKRRGRVLGMEHTEKKGEQVIEAEAPFGEMNDFAAQLRAITQGRGSYTYDFERYEEVPDMIAQKIIAEANANKD